jgi:hypothetical protein
VAAGVNTSDIPTIAERLAKVPNGALSVRLSLARTRFAYAQTSYARAKAMDEIDALKKAMFERGLTVAE